MRDSFVFYRSFFDGVKNLPNENQLKIYQAVLSYALDDIDISEELDPIEKTVFTLIKPQIDANNKRFEDGKKGGRPKKETEEENKKTTGFENKKPVVFKKVENKKPNVNVNDNENVNVNVNENGNVEEEVKEENPTPTASTSSEFLELNHFYGEYTNVYLDDEDYKKARAHCQDDTLLKELIEEVGAAIEKGKYPTYDPTRPHAHLVLIKAFFRYRRLNPKPKGNAPPLTKEERIARLKQMTEEIAKEHTV